MELIGLLPLVRSLPGYGSLQAALAQSGEESRAARAVVLEEAKAPLLAALAQDLVMPLLVVTARPGRASMLAEQFQSWLGPGAPIYFLPEPDVLPYERLSPDARTMQERLRVLHALSSWQADATSAPVIVGSISALVTRTIDPASFTQVTASLAQGSCMNWERVAAQWLQMGYERVTMVERPGQFARRGGIIDCYPPQMEEPFRLDLFGDEIENIRLFDPVSQRSTRLVQEVTVIPARELLGPPWSAAAPQLQVEECGPDARAMFARDLDRLERGDSVETPWFYAPLFNRWSVMDYLPTGALVVLEEPQEAQRALEELQARAQELRSGLLERKELPPDYPEPLLYWLKVEERSRARHRYLHVVRWGGENEEDLGFSPVPGYAGRLRALLSDLRQRLTAGERIVLVSLQSQRLSELLGQEEMLVKPIEHLLETPASATVTLVHGALPGGWHLSLSQEGPERPDGAVTMLTDVELFGFVKEARRRLARHAQRRENPLGGLSPGDYLVHVEHGFGRFVGTVVMTEGGVTKEYLFLEYAGGGRLYVPTDQVDRVARYVGPGGYTPTLSSLGTQEWERAKERVRQAALNVAKELLETAAARQVMPGLAFSPDTVWQQELEASFPYVETPDQMEAVRHVKQDMELPRPMDRIVCGDVGYGKTEVGMRAAFKAVQEGTQVAVLVPTTVLAQQHYQTFSQRLGAFPVKVEVLSRFRSEREQQDVLQGLRSGTVDIVIGTHRLVQKDVTFKNLGLVIVDEEQRFGLLHKEYFKRLRQEIDILTLSATPIPRTLYMALVGVREMSAMETPPEERLPIKTYVMEYEETMIRQALVRELERGGQVFFVHNRVQTIAHMAYQLGRLVPEANIAVAHGQMPEEVLERVMIDFAAGKHDVLVCTTIIESGLDLPNANTIIINDADKLGLAQLYQLRGRVGRGTRRAYAYLLYTRNKALTETAQKRLQAVFEATELGAGYYIAMKDLEIRGAGNLIGVEQSGQIGAVGFDLYCRILAAAVEDAKAEAQGKPLPSRMPQVPPITVDLRLAAYLPQDYVPDLDVRLDIYRRLAAAQGLAAVEELDQELRDRFGSPPAPAGNLLFAVQVKVLATQGGFASVIRDGGQVVLRLHEGLRVNPVPLQGLRGVSPGNNQVRVDATGNPGRWKHLLEKTLQCLV